VRDTHRARQPVVDSPYLVAVATVAIRMVIADTEATWDGELAATGLLTSLVADNQFVDLDRSERGV